MESRTFGPYVTTHLITRTEYATVYEARDDAGRRYAVKVLRMEGVEPSLVEALFHREIAALDGFEQDGIAPLRRAWREDDGTPILVFDLVPGRQTLQNLLVGAAEGAVDKPLSWRVTEALRLVRAVLGAHARHVVHRDLKPQNVLVDSDRDCLVIIDFGVANVLMQKVMNPAGRTLRDLFTRPYAAPEQRDHAEALFPADVHALGLVITALLSLHPLDDRFTPPDFDALWKPAQDELTAVLADAKAVAVLRERLRGCLAEKPGDRPTLSLLGDALEEVQASITPRPVATISLTKGASDAIRDLDWTPRDAVADLNGALSIRLDTTGPNPRIKMYGRTLLAVATWDEDESQVRVIDLKTLSGQHLANDRRSARPVKLVLEFGLGDGSALVQAAQEARRHVQSEKVERLLGMAERVITLERERLPVIEIEAVIENGAVVEKAREVRVSTAAGYTGSGADRVRVRNARVRVVKVRRVEAVAKKNALGSASMNIEELTAATVPSLFESFDAMQVVDGPHRVGAVARWEGDGATIAFDSETTLPRRVKYRIFDKARRDQLDKQESAIDKLRTRESRLTGLPELLTLTSEHTLEDRPEIVPFQGFLQGDARVRDVIERVLASTVSCVQGPPGTGKTTLIVELVLHLLRKDPRLRILVCSQANEAVANALERLKSREVAELFEPWPRPWIVRDVREELRNEKEHDGLEPAFRHEAGILSERATLVQPMLPTETARRAIDEWKRDLLNAANGTIEAFAQHVQVWGATTSRSPSTLDLMANADFWDVVIVDEAAKVTIAEVLVPLVSARRIVLIGDHKQLPAYLDSNTAEQLEQTGLDPDEAKLSLFEHLFETVLPDTHKGELLTQSRMHPTIGAVVSKLFYKGKLRHNVKPDARPLPAGRFNREHRVLFLGFRGADERTKEGSRRNPLEADAIGRVLAKLDAEATAAGQHLTVSVITPYKAQAHELGVRTKREWQALEVRAGTVDSFQGRQSDVVVYSLVRTGATQWQFLADPRRFNVALSRARSLLVLVGDLEGAPATPILERLLVEIPAENKLDLVTFLA